MFKETLRFGLILTIGLGLLFSIHFFVLQNMGLNNPKLLLPQSYLINYALAFVIFLIINFLKERKSNYLGFIFMGSSGLKFAFFFLIFYPVYKEDAELNRLEFLSFFIPYAVALILETTSLIKILNKS